MTYIVWNPRTKRLLHRLSLRAATDDDNNHPGNPPDDDDDDGDEPPDDDGNNGSTPESTEPDMDEDDGGEPESTAPGPRDDQEDGRRSGPHGNDAVHQRTLPSGTSLYAFQLKPEEIVGRHVLQKEEADGTRTRAKILELVEEFEGQRNSQPERINWCVPAVLSVLFCMAGPCCSVALGALCWQLLWGFFESLILTIKLLCNAMTILSMVGRLLSRVV